MRVKKVKRYYCDFCKKSGCAAGHMKKHEKRCIRNPQRFCGMCELMGRDQISLKDAIAKLPKQEDFKLDILARIASEDETDWFKYADACIPVAREAADNCPVCILAILVQAGVPALSELFDYKKEFDEEMQRHNEEHADSMNYGSMYGVY